MWRAHEIQPGDLSRHFHFLLARSVHEIISGDQRGQELPGAILGLTDGFFQMGKRAREEFNSIKKATKAKNQKKTKPK